MQQTLETDRQKDRHTPDIQQTPTCMSSEDSASSSMEKESEINFSEKDCCARSLMMNMFNSGVLKRGVGSCDTNEISE
jgi:hypothetical protein